MLARTEKSKDIIKVKITEPVTVGKVYEANLTDALLKDDADIKLEADIIAKKDAQITALQSKIAWFEDKVKTLSAIEWQEYNNIGG